MNKYYIHKQLIPDIGNITDTNWNKRQLWVLKLNSNDDILSFDDVDSAKSKRDELSNSDPTGRVYKIVKKIDDRTYEDII
jgi:hypothetical protein